jgi:hypothetical protein
VMNSDFLHPTIKGYQVWADELATLLTELLGPRSATDEAPPPTGDPSARRPGAVARARPAIRRSVHDPVPPLAGEAAQRTFTSATPRHSCKWAVGRYT